jgi:hypothetical protein
VGPLKLRKEISKEQKTRQLDQARPDEPKGTVADFRNNNIKIP